MRGRSGKKRPTPKKRYGDPRKRSPSADWSLTGGTLQAWIEKLAPITNDPHQISSLAACFDNCNQMVEDLMHLQRCRAQIDTADNEHTGEAQKQMLFEATETWFNTFYLALASFAAALRAHPKVFQNVPVSSMNRFVGWLAARFPLALPTNFLTQALQFRSMLAHPAMHPRYEWGIAFGTKRPAHVYLYGRLPSNGALPPGAAQALDGTSSKWSFQATDEAWTTNSLGVLLMTAVMQIAEWSDDKELAFPRVRNSYVGSSYQVIDGTLIIPLRATIGAINAGLEPNFDTPQDGVQIAPIGRSFQTDTSMSAGERHEAIVGIPPERVPLVLTQDFMKFLEATINERHSVEPFDERSIRSIAAFFDSTYRLLRKRDNLEALRKSVADHGGVHLSEHDRQKIVAASNTLFQNFYSSLSAFSAMVGRHSAIFGVDLPTTELSSFLPWLASVLPQGTPISPLEHARSFRTAISHPEQRLPFDSTVAGDSASLHVVLRGRSSADLRPPEGAVVLDEAGGFQWTLTAPDEDWVLDCMGLVIFMCISAITADSNPQSYLPPQVHPSTAISHILIHASGKVEVPATSPARW